MIIGLPLSARYYTHATRTKRLGSRYSGIVGILISKRRPRRLIKHGGFDVVDLTLASRFFLDFPYNILSFAD